MLRLRTLLWLLIVAAVGLTGASTLFAQDVSPQFTDPGWQASYWSNTTLSGQPSLERYDRDLNFNWGYASPDPSLPPDRFSARWTRYIDVTQGNYRFTATSDDGLRLWVDGQLVIDMWYDHAVLTRTGDIYLNPGTHLVEVQYYENTDVALVQVQWQLLDNPPPPPTPTPTPIPPPQGNTWRAEFFNNTSTSGPAVLVRNDSALDFNWGTGSPGAGVNSDFFSARWTQNINFPAGTYRFLLSVDDGARLFINGRTLIDAWREQPATDHIADIYLPGGPATVVVEYFENAGAAVAKLRWQPIGATTPPPPPPGNAVIVDDADRSFTRGGDPKGWAFVNEGYNGGLTWTQNNDWARPNYNWGRWFPSLQRGRYEVFVYIPDRYSTTGSAVYWISHAGGFTKRVVNQNNYSNQWVSLGTYNFRGSNKDYLSLADVTGERFLSRLIVWDAAKWEPR